MRVILSGTMITITITITIIIMRVTGTIIITISKNNREINKCNDQIRLRMRRQNAPSGGTMGKGLPRLLRGFFLIMNS